MYDFRNAAPRVRDLGTSDLSLRPAPEVPTQEPQHLPKYYIFAPKGPVGSTFVDMNLVSLTRLYGTDAFDPSTDFYRHTTPFLQNAASNANNMVVHRVIPDDANDRANVVVYLEVLTLDYEEANVLKPGVPVYEKNADGSLVMVGDNPVQATDGNGPIFASGYMVRWVAETVTRPYNTYTPGAMPTKVGTLVDPADVANTSLMYPIFECWSRDPGSEGNRSGFRFWPARKTDLTEFPTSLFEETACYPYYFGFIKTTDVESGRVSEVVGNFNSTQTRAVLKDRQRDPLSGAVIDAKTSVRNAFIDTNLTYNFNDVGGFHVYDQNLLDVLTELYTAETAVEDQHRDDVVPFINLGVDPDGNPDPLNYFAINIATLTSANNSPYQAIKVAPGGISPSRHANIFFGGGSDGTMSNSVLDTAVIADCERYSNPLDEYMDLVNHPESIMYDSGFGIDAKNALGNFISLRKDTAVILSTLVAGASVGTMQEQIDRGNTLRDNLSLYPESAFFGTETCRGMVFMGSGILAGSNYDQRIPVSYELHDKACRYMGAGEGRWRSGERFDSGESMVFRNLRDIDITWVPASTRETLWASGINFALTYRVREYFFPALKTVYDSDGSVLNNFFAVVALAYLNKLAHTTWRRVTGTSRLTPRQLEERVNNIFNGLASDRFDQMFVVRANATVTEEDAQRGYSFTLPYQLYGNNMATVMTTYAEVFRMSDLNN